MTKQAFSKRLIFCWVLTGSDSGLSPDRRENFYLNQWWLINTLRPRRNEPHLADDIFKRIFFNENVWISIKISLKFVPKGPINNIPALVQIMAWRRSGDKPLSEPVMVSSPTHICVTRPQWVKRGTSFGTIFRGTWVRIRSLKDAVENSVSKNVGHFVSVLMCHKKRPCMGTTRAWSHRTNTPEHPVWNALLAYHSCCDCENVGRGMGDEISKIFLVDS